MICNILCINIPWKNKNMSVTNDCESTFDIRLVLEWLNASLKELLVVKRVNLLGGNLHGLHAVIPPCHLPGGNQASERKGHTGL